MISWAEVAGRSYAHQGTAGCHPGPRSNCCLSAVVLTVSRLEHFLKLILCDVVDEQNVDCSFKHLRQKGQKKIYPIVWFHRTLITFQKISPFHLIGAVCTNAMESVTSHWTNNSCQVMAYHGILPILGLSLTIIHVWGKHEKIVQTVSAPSLCWWLTMG